MLSARLRVARCSGVWNAGFIAAEARGAGPPDAKSVSLGITGIC